MNDFFDYILNSNFLASLFELLIDVMIGLVQLILLPFDLLIKNYIPELNDLLFTINDVFVMVGHYTGWAISALAIPGTVISLVLLYYTFDLTVSIASWSYKIVLKWVDVFL